jgi:hypothetical protein
MKKTWRSIVVSLGSRDHRVQEIIKFKVHSVREVEA